MSYVLRITAGRAPASAIARAIATVAAMLLVPVVPAIAADPGSGGTPSTSGSGGSGSGGAGITGPAPSKPPPSHLPPTPSRHAKGKWLKNFEITEYWPAPESWFVGRSVSAPGLPGKHRIDWLYSATGVSMQGEGIGLDGRMYHIASLGDAGWVTVDGSSTAAASGFAGGAPYWRAGAYWRNRKGGVTFPLQAGGWSSGEGRKYVPLPGVSFAAGPSLPLKYYQSIAVDPRVIPLGSRVYIPSYKHDGHGGWFVAQDTGGAIGGHHLDVYRSPPSTPNDSGQLLTGQRVYVIRPKKL